MSKTIPGPQGRFLIGNLGEIDNNQLHVSLYNMNKKHGHIFEFWIFSQRVIVIGDLTLMERAFSRQELCHRPANFLKEVKYSGSGYLDSNFTDDEVALKSKLWNAIAAIRADGVLTKLCAAELDNFLDSIDTASDVSVVQCLTRSMAKQYATVLTGTEASEDHGDVVLEWINSLKNIYSGGKASLLTKLPWLRYIPGPFKTSVKRLYEARDRLAETLVTTAREHLQRSSKPHGILQNMMSAEGWETSTEAETDATGKCRDPEDKQLIACTMDILFNAVVPIAHFVAFILLQATKHPDMQHRIHEELENKMAVLQRSDVKVTEFLRKHTPFLEAFILESMRLISLVNVSVPHEVAEDAEVEGYLFPKGSVVLGDLFSMHHDDTLWEQPWSFDPNRFLDGDGKALPETDPVRKHLVHFGLGIRRCRGSDSAMEHVYRYAVGMFARFNVVAGGDSALPTSDPLEYPTAIVIAVPEFQCKFERQKDDSMVV